MAKFAQALRNRCGVIAYAGDESETGYENSGHARSRIDNGRRLTRDRVVTVPEINFEINFDTQMTPVNAGD